MEVEPSNEESPKPERGGSVWSGEGWSRLQRQIGVTGLIALFGAEVFLKADIPVGLYSIVGGLLGLDLLVDALDGLRK